MQNAMRKIGSVARHLRRARRFSVIFLLRFTLRSVNRWFCAWKVRLISSFAPYLSPLLSFLTSSFPTLPRRRILRCKIKRARALPRLRRGSVGKDEASRRQGNKENGNKQSALAHSRPKKSPQTDFSQNARIVPVIAESRSIYFEAAAHNMRQPPITFISFQILYQSSCPI